MKKLLRSWLGIQELSDRIALTTARVDKITKPLYTPGSEFEPFLWSVGQTGDPIDYGILTTDETGNTTADYPPDDQAKEVAEFIHDTTTVSEFNRLGPPTYPSVGPESIIKGYGRH